MQRSAWALRPAVFLKHVVCGMQYSTVLYFIVCSTLVGGLLTYRLFLLLRYVLKTTKLIGINCRNMRLFSDFVVDHLATSFSIWSV